MQLHEDLADLWEKAFLEVKTSEHFAFTINQAKSILFGSNELVKSLTILIYFSEKI